MRRLFVCSSLIPSFLTGLILGAVMLYAVSSPPTRVGQETPSCESSCNLSVFPTSGKVYLCGPTRFGNEPNSSPTTDFGCELSPPSSRQEQSRNATVYSIFRCSELPIGCVTTLPPELMMPR